MFGVGKGELDAALAALEERLTARADATAAGLRALVDERIAELRAELAGDPAERTRLLLNSAAAGLRAELDALLADADALRRRSGELGTAADDLEEAQKALTERLSGGGLAPYRKKGQFNTVYHADALIYVSIYFTGGRTDVVSLLIGDEDPPTRSYGEANVAGDMNSYIGGVVRPGEYWMARSRRSESALKCVITPLY